MKPKNPESLPPFDPKTGNLNAIIETPKRSRNKYKWDDKQQLYKLSNVLPSGNYFPYDFGFIPSTEGDDGDPLDVLLLMEEPVFPGCLVPSRLIGVIEADEDGVRNDRLVAVAEDCPSFDSLESLCDLPDEHMRQIDDFFVSYHRTEKKKFKILGVRGPKQAQKMVEDGIKTSKNGKDQ